MYTVLNGMVAVVGYVSGGRIEPREYELKEYWTWKGVGRPPWFVRVMQHCDAGKNGDTNTTSSQDGSDDADGSISMIRVKTISNDFSTTNGERKV